MKQLWIMAVVGVMISGCSTSQPSADTAQAEMRVIDGKRFAVPAGATTSAHLATDKEIEFYKKSGVEGCQKGDVIWDAKGAQEQIAKAIKEGNPNIHKTLAKQGLIGCAHPVN